MTQPPSIPPLDQQFDILSRGAVDLNPLDAFKKQLTESFEKQKPLLVKTGFDPTAPDLHFGHTVLIQKMAQFQKLGHRVVFLVGDYTALIGDPTGRNSMRPPLSPDEIQQNAKTYTDQVFKILDRDKTEVRFNSEWLQKLSFHDVITLASRYNVGRMLERRDFRQRFDQNQQIAVHEFLYPLMQAYDSVALKADIELGGHDQIFNLNVGRHMMEAYGLRPQSVLTVGLLLGLDGHDKMSKSKNNHIGVLDEPRDMFGKVMSISDETMQTWIPLLLDKDPNADTQSDPLAAKKHLAETLVARFHGENIANEILAWWNAGRPLDTGETQDIPQSALYQVVVAIGFATSNGDARRKISQGGVSLNEERIEDPNYLVLPGEYLLKVGKKSAARIRIHL